jgi:DNA-binding MurR/RpiR family transcriptional regulator
LAEITATSRTTVWRLVQKLGYGTYSEFKYDFVNSLEKYSYFNRILPEECCETDEGMLSSYIDMSRSVIDDLEKTIDLNEVKKVVVAVHDAKRVCFYTYGRYYSEVPFQINLSIDGKKTDIFVRHSDLINDVKTLDETCMVFIATLDFPDTTDMEPIFKEIQGKGPKVFLFGLPNSRYRKYAHFFAPYAKTGTMVGSYTMLMYYDLINVMYRKKYIDSK